MMTMTYITGNLFCLAPPGTKASRFHHQRGLSLIELMISIAIGLFLMIGITALIVQQGSTRTELEKSSRQIENGRYAMQILHNDIQHAGYYGEYSTALSAPGLDSWNTAGTLPDPCTTTIVSADPAVAQLVPAIPLHLQGYNNVPATMPTPPSTCLDAVNHLDGTDILVIRRAATTTVLPHTDAVANQPYLQTGTDPITKNLGYVFGSKADLSVFTLQTSTGTPAPLRPYMVRIYFVSPCSNPADDVCADTDDNIPTLRRMTLGPGPAFETESLVEGIENLQIDYGIDYPVAPATIGDGSVDCYVSDPAAPTVSEIGACPASAAAYFAVATAATNWSNVMAVRLNILARNTEPTAGYSDGKKIYNLGGAGNFGPFSDQYKRHVFSGLVRTINPSGRRE